MSSVTLCNPEPLTTVQLVTSQAQAVTQTNNQNDVTQKRRLRRFVMEKGSSMIAKSHQSEERLDCHPRLTPLAAKPTLIVRKTNPSIHVLWLPVLVLCAFSGISWSQANWVTGQPYTAPPIDAVVTGYEANGTPLYTCRGGSKEGYQVQVGKFRQGFAGCNFGFGGKDKVVTDFQILTTSWQTAYNGNVPSNAVIGGWESPSGPLLYYCRGSYGGALTPGKIRPGFSGCYISYQGREVLLSGYQVMVNLSPALPLNVNVYSPPFYGYIPFDAIRGGTDIDGLPLFVCSGFLNGGVHPGTIRPGWPGCEVTYGASTTVAVNYNVLVPKWEPASNDGFSFPAGVDIDGNALEVCRANYQGGLHPGKHKILSPTCNIGWSGFEVPLTSFDALSNPIQIK